MAVAFVQSATAAAHTTNPDTATCTFGVAPTSGHTIFLAVLTRYSGTITYPAGFTEIYLHTNDGSGPTNMRSFSVAYKVAGGAEGTSYATTQAVPAGVADFAVVASQFSGVGTPTFDHAIAFEDYTAATIEWLAIPGQATGAEQLMFLLSGNDNSIADNVATPGSPVTYLNGVATTDARLDVGWRTVASSAPPYTYSGSITSGWLRGHHIALTVGGVPPPDPEPGGGVFGPTDADPIPITDYLVSWRITRGASAEITGGASPGSAVITVKNHADDRFNPENGASPLAAYLRDGTAVWIGVNNDGKLTGANPRGLFGGRITDITPLPAGGSTHAPLVEIQAEDALGWLGRIPVRTDFVRGLSQDAFRALVLQVAGETRVDLDSEIHTLALASGDGNALSILEGINKSNGTRHFAKPADASTDWYTYTTRNRQWRLDATVDGTLSQQDDHVTAMSGWRLSADTVTNQQKATVTPITFTPNTYEVWRAENLPINLVARRPYTVWVEFDDYVDAPTLNIASTGASVISSLTSFGTSAKISLTALTHAAVTALTIEGALARRWPSQSWIADDLTSQTLPRGVRAGSEISGEYVGSIAAATGIAEHVVWRYGDPQVRPTLTVSNWFPEMFDLDLYDVISYSSPQLGVTSRLFEIVGLTHEATVAADSVQSHTVTYVLQECKVQADPGWIVLDSSVLDSSDILAY